MAHGAQSVPTPRSGCILTLRTVKLYQEVGSLSESKAYENNLSSLIWHCAQGDSNLEQREDGKTWGPLCHKKDKTENELGAVLWPQCLEVVQSVLPDVWR